MLLRLFLLAFVLVSGGVACSNGARTLPSDVTPSSVDLGRLAGEAAPAGPFTSHAAAIAALRATWLRKFPKADPRAFVDPVPGQCILADPVAGVPASLWISCDLPVGGGGSVTAPVYLVYSVPVQTPVPDYTCTLSDVNFDFDENPVHFLARANVSMNPSTVSGVCGTVFSPTVTVSDVSGSGLQLYISALTMTECTPAPYCTSYTTTTGATSSAGPWGVGEEGTCVFVDLAVEAGASPTPTPSPSPTPIAAVAMSQLPGDFARASDGGVSTYEPGTIALAYLVPFAGTTAAHRRNASSSATASAFEQPAALPAGYQTAPPNLPENNGLVADFASVVSDLAQPIPACLGFLEEDRAVSADLGDPRNPAYFQIQTYCENGASIVPGSITSTWQGAPYNGGAPLTKTVNQTCTNLGTDSLGLQKCFTQVALVPLASGHAEINGPASLNYSLSVLGLLDLDFQPLYFGNASSFFLNNRSVPYPLIPVPSTWGPPASIVDGAVAPPIYPPYDSVDSDCYDGSAAAKILGEALRTDKPVRYPLPGPGFQAHHVKPLCWGGTNVASNGVWLPTTSTGYPNLHQPFTTWFRRANFTP